MFDNPGKKLNQLKDELLSIEDGESENFATEFEDTAYDDEEFDEGSAVLVEEKKKNRGGATLVLLLVVALGAYVAARWMGWI